MATLLNTVKVFAQEQMIGFDTVTASPKNGTLKFRRDFFYTHGVDSKMAADKIMGQLPKDTFKATLVDHSEIWNAWPKDSYFEVIVKIGPKETI